MEYKHFSHPHNLISHRLHELGHHPVLCSGCEFPCDNSATLIHSCRHCNFFLHDHCANANRYVKHPSHKPHPLILLPYPTYSSGSFICNACGRPGRSFSYCCTLCEVDLHVGCAFLPLKATHRAHHHELHLYYGVPVVPRKGSSTDQEFCNVCSEMLEARHWAYCCVKCNFSAHTFCSTTEVVPGLYTDDSVDSGVTEEQGAAVGGGGGGGDGNKVEVELTEEELVQLFNIKLQMQLAEQIAQSMATLSSTG